MRSRTIRLAELTPAEETEWRDLGRRAVEPNPFFESDCLMAAWRHLPEAAGLCVVVAEEDGRFHACMPVGPAGRWSRLRRPALLGRAETTAMVLGTPLVDPSHGLEAVATLLQGVRDQAWTVGAGLLVLDWLGDEGPVAPLVRQAAAQLGLTRSEVGCWYRPGLYRRADPREHPLVNLGKQRRRKMGQQRRRLAELVGPLEVVDRARDQAAVAEFLRLESSGWKQAAPDGEAFARREATVAFFGQLCARFAASGRLLLLSLEAEGKSMAMLCCLRAGAGLFTYRAGYDEAFGRYSPGLQLFLAAVEYMHHSTDAAWLDSCTTPDNRYLPDLLPDSLRLTTTVIALGGPVDRATVRALPAIWRAKQAIGASLRY